jgi:hypothetical protein
MGNTVATLMIQSKVINSHHGKALRKVKKPAQKGNHRFSMLDAVQSLINDQNVGLPPLYFIKLMDILGNSRSLKHPRQALLKTCNPKM